MQIRSSSLNKLFEKYIRGPEHPMKQRIISYLHQIFNYKAIRSTTKFNFDMYLDLRDLIQRNIFFNYEWEPNLSKFINNELQQSDVFFDIGSNVGYFALLAAQKKGEVYAFEPDPNNVFMIDQNKSINNFDNISTLNVGLGEKDESLKFYRAKIANNGLSGFTDRNSEENFLTPVRTLDTLIYEEHLVPIPSFLKIDTEGWEEKVLLGASKLLKTNPPRIIVFESEFLGDQSINNFKDINDFLQEHNYIIDQTLNDNYGINHVARYNGKREIKKQKITVIIPTFNSSSTLQETLNSVELQDQKVQIIIIDNISKDHTLEIAQDFKTRSKHDVLILSNPVPNVSISRNIGIDQSKGNYILFLDSDDLLKPHALTILLNQGKHYDIVFGGWEDFDSSSKEILSTITYKTELSENSFCKYFKYKPTISTALIRKDFLVKWREDMKVWEVTQFFLDILLNGARSIFIPTIVTCIRQSNSENRLSILHDHFEPINTINFLIANKNKLKDLGKLDDEIEEVIDKEIINYFYKALNNKGSKLELKLLFKVINLKLLPKYKDYTLFGIYHFIFVFNGFRGLNLFYLLNRLMKRH